jgi:hypothetical protein
MKSTILSLSIFLSSAACTTTQVTLLSGTDRAFRIKYQIGNEPNAPEIFSEKLSRISNRQCRYGSSFRPVSVQLKSESYTYPPVSGKMSLNQD